MQEGRSGRSATRVGADTAEEKKEFAEMDLTDHAGQVAGQLAASISCLAVRGEPVGRPGFPGAGGHDCAGADCRRCASLRGWRGGLPTGQGRAADRVGCRRPRAAGHGRDPSAGRAGLVVMDKRHGFSILCEISRGERVPGDPACAALHPADDRGAGYVRPVAALLAAGCGWSRRGGVAGGVRHQLRRFRRWQWLARVRSRPAAGDADEPGDARGAGCRGHHARGEHVRHPGERESRKFPVRDLTERSRPSSAGRAPGGALHALHRRGDDHVD